MNEAEARERAKEALSVTIDSSAIRKASPVEIDYVSNVTQSLLTAYREGQESMRQTMNPALAKAVENANDNYQRGVEAERERILGSDDEPDWESKEQGEFVHLIRCAVWKADERHKQTGGGTRHWVRECLLPCLWNDGFRIVRHEIKSGQQAEGTAPPPFDGYTMGPDGIARRTKSPEPGGQQAEGEGEDAKS